MPLIIHLDGPESYAIAMCEGKGCGRTEQFIIHGMFPTRTRHHGWRLADGPVTCPGCMEREHGPVTADMVTQEFGNR